MEGKNVPFLLELCGAGKKYEMGPGVEPVEALQDVSLAIRAGESAAVVGPSGSGKTTLLNLMGGLDHPTAGRVLFEGKDLSALGERDLARFRNREIGFVFQSHFLLPQLDALENVLLPTLAAGGAGSSRRAFIEKARGLLESLGLGAAAGRRPGQLSIGECQRVAVARALVMGPRLVLADEPTGSLDRASAEGLKGLLAEECRRRGAALVVATHDGDLAARMERRWNLYGGRLSSVPGS